MKITWRAMLATSLLAIVLLLWPKAEPTTGPMVAGDVRPTIPGPDASGATGRAGDSLAWEIYAERVDLGRVPAQVWVHGPGWSVACQVRPPGSVPASGCVTVREPAKAERGQR